MWSNQFINSKAKRQENKGKFHGQGSMLALHVKKIKASKIESRWIVFSSHFPLSLSNEEEYRIETLGIDKLWSMEWQMKCDRLTFEDQEQQPSTAFPSNIMIRSYIITVYFLRGFVSLLWWHSFPQIDYLVFVFLIWIILDRTLNSLKP